jgi:hypothetical protein
MTEKLWGPIDPDRWQEVPCTRARVAEEEDVKQGRAAFYFGNLSEVPAWPEDLKLPALATWTDDSTGQRRRVVVIQAERSANQCTVGFRFLDGGNGVCLLEELEFAN